MNDLLQSYLGSQTNSGLQNKLLESISKQDMAGNPAKTQNVGSSLLELTNTLRNSSMPANQ